MFRRNAPSIISGGCRHDKAAVGGTARWMRVVAGVLLATIGTVAHAFTCDQVPAAAVSRAVDLPVTDATTRRSRDGAGAYVLHRCEWNVLGEDGGLVVLSLRLAADDGNIRDIRQMRANLSRPHRDTVVDSVPDVGDYAEYAYSAASSWAGVTALKDTTMADVTAWNVRGLGKGNRYAFVMLVRAVLESLNGAAGQAPDPLVRIRAAGPDKLAGRTVTN